MWAANLSVWFKLLDVDLILWYRKPLKVGYELLSIDSRSETTVYISNEYEVIITDLEIFYTFFSIP